MKTASRKIRVAVTALCTVFALCSLALAVGAVDTSKTCALAVKLGANALDTSAALPGAEAEKLTLTANLYKVAAFDGAAYTYTADPHFDAALNGYAKFTPEQMGAQAAKAAAVIQEQGIAPTNPAPVTFAGNAAAGGRFENMPCGLYLLLTTAVDSTGEYNYTFTPVLLSLPSMNSDGSDNYNDNSLELKFSREPATTSIKIKKDLTAYSERQGPATFIFQVEAVKGETTVYSNVFSMVFTAAGSREITVENLPVGAKVTVSEVYGGSSYTVNGSDTVVIENLAKPEPGAAPATAAFVNDYNKKTPTSHSVTNQYTYTDGAWAVNQVPDAE